MNNHETILYENTITIINGINEENLNNIKLYIYSYDETQTDLIVELDSSLIDNCIYKVSICLDGISLTIAGIDNNNVKLAIIPYTIKNTTLKTKEVGDMLNVETDMFAKYVNNMQLGDK